MEILSSDPIYDEYSDELEKRPFESACIKFFSGSESVFASNEGNGKKIKENYAMNIFDFRILKFIRISLSMMNILMKKSSFLNHHLWNSPAMTLYVTLMSRKEHNNTQWKFLSSSYIF